MHERGGRRYASPPFVIPLPTLYLIPLSPSPPLSPSHVSHPKGRWNSANHLGGRFRALESVGRGSNLRICGGS